MRPVRCGMTPRRSKKFEGLDLEPVATVQARSLRSRTIKIETSPCTVQSVVPISEPTIAKGTPGDNTRILRSRTVRTDTSSCSDQLSIVPISEPTIANRTPGDNTRSLRSRKVTTDASPCPGQHSVVPISEPTIANGTPGDNTRILRSRTVKTDSFACSGQLSIVPTSEPTIANRTPGDKTRSLRSRKVKTDASPCSGQHSVVPISDPTIANGTPGDNTRILRSRTIKTDSFACSGQLSIVPISEPTIANGTPGDNTRSLRSRTVKIDSSPCSGQHSVVPSAEPNIANGTPGDNIRSLRSRTVKTNSFPCSGQLSIVPISEPTVANGTPGDNTRSLCSHTVKTETSSCSSQLSIVPISEPSIANRTPGDIIEKLVKLTEDGLPEDYIKEVKLPGGALRRKHTFYVDPKTGYAFHSLEDALQYAQTGSILSCVIIPQKRSEEEVLALMNSPEAGTPCRAVETQTAKCSSQVRLCPDGLPGDWIKEEKSRKNFPNKKEMFYIDPKTGYAFRSLKDALRYVETGDIHSCTTRPQKWSMEEIRTLSNHTIESERSASPPRPSNLINDENSGDNVCKVVQESQLTSYGLPKSWIKELKPRKDGTKMDPYYVDPDTGYAFLSLKDALRYVATGNIRSCIVRPRKRSIEEVQALISSSEISSISGMKTVQQESLQLVQHDNVHRKRKRSSMKPSKQKLKEDLKINGTDDATGAASPRRKKHRKEPSCIRASPRLLALKAKIMTDCDGNLEENTDSCNTMPDASALPYLKRVLNSQPDLKSEKEPMAENGSSTRTQLQSKKLNKEEPVPMRASPCFATPETKADITSLKSKNSMMSKSVLEPVHSSEPCPNSQPSCYPEFKHEEIEGASLNSTGTLLQSGKMHREKPAPLRASSRLAALDAVTDASSVEHENGTTSNDLIDSSSFSLSYENTRLTSDLELVQKIELANNSSTKAPSRRRKVHRERQTPRKATSRLLAQNVTIDTCIENEKSMMNDVLLESLPSLSHLNLRPTSQPDLEMEETTEQASNSLTKKPSCKWKVHREKHTPLRASCCSAQNVMNDATSVKNKNSRATPLYRGMMRREKPMHITLSHLAAMDATNDVASVENKNKVVNNVLFNQSPSFLFLNTNLASQPGLELKDEIQAANAISTGTSLQRGEKHTERPMPISTSSHQAALKQTSDCTSGKNEDITNTIFETWPPSHPDLNFGSTSLSDLDLKDEQVQEANSSSTGTFLQRWKKHTERPMPRTDYSHQAVPRQTTNCTSQENEDDNVTNSVFERPPPFYPDLNLGSTSHPDMEIKEEVITAANARGSKTILQGEKLLGERSATVINSSHLSTLSSTLAVTSNENHKEENEDGSVINSIFERSPPHPDLNLGSTSLPDMGIKEEAITGANARGYRTILQGEKLFRERSATIIKSSHISTLSSTLVVASNENRNENNKIRYAVSEFPPPARPDLNFGPTSQPYREPMEDAIAAGNGSAIRTTSWRVEPHREVPTCIDASPRLEAVKVTSVRISSKSNDKNSMVASALSEPSHYPGRPDLNLGPASQLSVELQKEIANDSTTGNPLWRKNLHGVKPAPVVAMTQAPCCNYENNIKISNYFCGPVDSPVSQINRGSTSQPNPVEVWHDNAAAPSTVIAEGKNAPDLNMVPMSWSEPEYDLDCALKTNPGPKLEQQQQPVGLNTIGEFHLQSPVPSEMLYQDPTMDALLSGQEPGLSMPHMSIDALNSPVSPFFGDFWHDPCLSYAFRTLTGGVNQQQANLASGPENNVNWTSIRNGGPSENPSIGPSGTTSRTLQSMNNGTPQHMNHGTLQYMNNGTLQYMNNGTPQHINNGTLQYMNNGMPQYMNNGTPFQK